MIFGFLFRQFMSHPLEVSSNSKSSLLMQCTCSIDSTRSWVRFCGKAWVDSFGFCRGKNRESDEIKKSPSYRERGINTNVSWQTFGYICIWNNMNRYRFCLTIRIWGYTAPSCLIFKFQDYAHLLLQGSLIGRRFITFSARVPLASSTVRPVPV